MKSRYWKTSHIYDRSNMDMSRLFKGVSIDCGFTQSEVNDIEKEAIALINIGWSIGMAVKRAIDATVSARYFWNTQLLQWQQIKH